MSNPLMLQLFHLRVITAAGLAVLLVTGAGARSAAQRGPAPAAESLPDPAIVLKNVRENLERDAARQARYTYVETRRQLRIDESGVSRVAEEKVFEVYPDEPEGEVYRRLVRRNGVPLTSEELAREDANRARDLARRVSETPAERARRLQREDAERREDRDELEDAMRVFDVRLVGFDTFEGRRMLAATLTPRPGAQTRTRVGNYLKRFGGRAWITPDDHQLVKIDLTAQETIRIGWGLLGRIHEGSRATFRRTLVDDEVWMPKRGHLQVSGRALLVKPVRIDATIEYSDYRRLTTETARSTSGR